MRLDRMHFAEFFAEVNNGHRPFRWQQRLLDHLLEHGRWPDVIAAPTGAGKSAVIEVHVFATALSSVGQAPRLPRRLSVVVGRRALVDNQQDRAERISAYLESTTSDVGVSIRHALLSLVPESQAPEPLVIGHLRGGLPTDRGWLDDPRACAVICATPDMWGSRLLMRGYGSSRQARPREAGFLAYDSVMVLDEAHLNQHLLAAARRVGELESAYAEAMGVPGLQAVETTATPQQAGPGHVVIAVDRADLEPGVDDALVRRLTLPKPTQYHGTDHWSGKRASKGYVHELAELVRVMVAESPDGTIGCVVNRVDTAIRVAHELRDLNTACWVGRMRPNDVAQVREDCAGLFSESDGPKPQVLVATQTVEVGVDIDLAGLVTELAPGSALAQRAGRVNRIGKRDAGPIVIVGPQEAVPMDQLPYRQADLQDAYTWAQGLPPEGMSPWSLVSEPAPSPRPQRDLVKRVELSDAWRWSATYDMSLAEETLELWIRDSLERDEDPLGLVLRDGLPDDDALALALLRQVPIDDGEVFPAAGYLVRGILDRVLDKQDGRAFVQRDGDIVQLGTGESHLGPGDILILDMDVRCTRQGVVTEDPDPDEVPTSYWGGIGVEVVLPRSERGYLLSALADLTADQAQGEFEAMTGEELQVLLPPEAVLDGGPLPWLVLTPPEVAIDDESIRQEWTCSPGEVTLEQHSSAVAARGAAFGWGIGLRPDLVETLQAAGRFHDEGKRDPRFQRERLDAPQGVVLAKSVQRSAQSVTRRRRRTSLGVGWRHEMRSVVVSWADLSHDANAELAARLVGTSHGYGRRLPNNRADDLMTAGDPDSQRAEAVRLFDEGEWSSLMERTETAHGVWGCAYLEAVLRSADCQVSKEGS